MPLNKHEIFYVLLSFLIDEVNHTAQPKIVAAYPQLQFPKWREISFSILIEKLNGAYNLNCDPIGRIYEYFSGQCFIEPKRKIFHFFYVFAL